jgi:hypothetical protein
MEITPRRILRASDQVSATRAVREVCKMSGRAVVFAAVATGLLVFVVPYVVSVLFGVAPNGTETLIVVSLLWGIMWTISRTRFKRDTQPR